MPIRATKPLSFRVEDAIQILERTPGALRAMLAGLGVDWTYGNYGADTFSPFDVVGHLIHGEQRDWMPRLRRILEEGPRVPFDAFDRHAQYAANQGRKIEDLLAEFARLRSANVSKLRSLKLTEEMLAMPGKHPDLGAVTLRQLLATWVVHDLNHVRQIARAMAWQYRNEVGPWKEYLPILKGQ